MSTCTVRARSAAEMPVVTPLRASTETVNGVPNSEPLSAGLTIIGMPRSSMRSAVIGMQIRPRPYRAMKLIASGVQNSAAMTRSPSFSRLSSSTMTTNWPARKSSIASSIVANPASRRRETALLVIVSSAAEVIAYCLSAGTFGASGVAPGRLQDKRRVPIQISLVQQLLHVAGDDI